jgi:undecaprenyl diphosphate synthase
MASKPQPAALGTVPTHIAIIMDGNGRWAAARRLPRMAGHRAGTENLRHIITACVELGIKHLTIYAFSTENWKRPGDEVQGLMQILADVLQKEIDELHEKGVRIVHIGRLEGLTPELRDQIVNAVRLTESNDRLILNVAWNYGGRDEIVHAVQEIARLGLPPEQITEQVVARHMFSTASPDPDLIIRTSGEMRTSNFLVWQGAYSEWYFTETLWPDFGKQALEEAITAYKNRSRRFGGRTPREEEKRYAG